MNKQTDIMKDKRSIEVKIFVYNKISFYVLNSMPPSGRVMFEDHKEIGLGGLIVCTGNYAQYGVFILFSLSLW
jgi:hypothetical protein